MVLLEWDRPEALWAVAADGQVWRSVITGRTWERRGQLGAPPDALLAQAGTLYAAYGGQAYPFMALLSAAGLVGVWLLRRSGS